MTTYRDDLEATHRRADDLEAELVHLRERNAQLEQELARPSPPMAPERRVEPDPVDVEGNTGNIAAVVVCGGALLIAAMVAAHDATLGTVVMAVGITVLAVLGLVSRGNKES